MKRILIWAGPNQIWDLGRPSSKLVQPKSELGSGLDQFRTGSDSDLGLDKQIYVSFAVLYMFKYL